jgi:hypothetical protein
MSQTWWLLLPIVPALGRLRLEDHKLDASLGYIARLCLKKKQKNPNMGFSPFHKTITQKPQIVAMN